MRVARRAGKYDATRPAARSTTHVPPRATGSVGLTSNKSVEISLQVLNVFGTDNHIGGTGGTFINSALSNQFGTYTVTSPRQEAEVGARFKF